MARASLGLGSGAPARNSINSMASFGPADSLGKIEILESNNEFAKLNPKLRGRVPLGNLNPHDAFMDCESGRERGGDGLKMSIMTWLQSWYLALALNLTVAFSLLL